MTTPQIFYIYALLEDWSDEVRYVGKTTRPKARLREHIRSIPQRGEANSLKRAWIDEALDRGVTIRLKTIETCTKENVDERESYWVQRYLSLGHRLTNGTETGGSGAWRPNPLRKPRVGIATRPRQAKKKRTFIFVSPPELTTQEILALWAEGWDGYRAIVDESMVLARPHHDKIEQVRDYLADKPALALELDALLVSRQGEYPVLRGLTKQEWLERATQFDEDERLEW